MFFDLIRGPSKSVRLDDYNFCKHDFNMIKIEFYFEFSAHNFVVLLDDSLGIRSKGSLPLAALFLLFDIVGGLQENKGG